MRGVNFLYNKSRMYAIIVSFALITPLLLINHFLFNNVMNILTPLIEILVTVSTLRHAKSSQWYFRVAPIVLIGTAVYLVLPSYTLSRAEQKSWNQIRESCRLNREIIHQWTDMDLLHSHRIGFILFE